MSKRAMPPVIFLLLAMSVGAASVTLSPAKIYEATTSQLALDVNNYKGNATISSVSLNTSGLPLTSVEGYSGWTAVQNANSAYWTGGNLGSNVRSALFEFSLAAPLVSQNTSATLTVTLNSASTPLTLTILNDNTPPNITNATPNGYVQASVQAISVQATDPETGVQSVTYSTNNCTSGPNTTMTLAQNGTSFTGSANFSAYTEGSKACYTITAQNNAGETSTFTGELVVDGTPPNVTLLEPNGFTSENAQFKLVATDNLASTLTCTISLNGTQLETFSAANGSQSTVTKNLTGFPEGQHFWSATCYDGVGLSNTQVQSAVLDKQPPAIAIENFSMRRTRPTSFSANVQDTIGLSDVNPTFENILVTLAQSGTTFSGTLLSNTLGVKPLLISARDNVGHTTEHTVDVTVVPNHAVNLVLSPSTATPGQTIMAQGSVTPDGTLNSTSVLVRTPDGNYTLTLVNNIYAITFTVPSTGNYTVTAEYLENGYLYSAQQTLVVQNAVQETRDYSHGIGFSMLNKKASGETTTSEATKTESQAPAPAPEEQPAPKPAEYTPLTAETPREALTPKATGIFSLGKKLNWLAPLLALALLGTLGVYAYRKRPPREEKGINWNEYFKD